MKASFTAIAVTAATVLAAGCAGPDYVSEDRAAERVYVTGSNLPKKANAPADANIPMGMGIRVQTREDLERIQNSGSGVMTDTGGLSNR